MSDYPHGRGRVRVEACGMAIEGVSIAGHESFYKLPGFRALLEFGRAPEDTVSYATVFLSHGHLDHAAGLAHYASRRRLQGLAPARVFAPREAVNDLASWLQACERLESIAYEIQLEPAVPGASVKLRNDLEVEFLPGSHRVPTVGYLFREVKQKLKAEFAGVPGEEIAALRRRGIEVTERQEIPLLAYPGDCDRGIFAASPEILRARVLLIECSFVFPEDVERARVYAHLHLNDFIENADRFENEAIVLTHFSQRYRPEEIRAALASLPPALASRVIPFLPSA
jgi:ribonuclease Z